MGKKHYWGSWGQGSSRLLGFGILEQNQSRAGKKLLGFGILEQQQRRTVPRAGRIPTRKEGTGNIAGCLHRECQTSCRIEAAIPWQQGSSWCWDVAGAAPGSVTARGCLAAPVSPHLHLLVGVTQIEIGSAGAEPGSSHSTHGRAGWLCCLRTVPSTAQVPDPSLSITL